uniref:Disks large-associated protein 1 n=1 Tax=Macrostomum lignano TaxID=282301 RepID=A0A1I8J3K3_9PLAT
MRQRPFAEKLDAVSAAAAAAAATAAGYGRQGSPLVFDVALESRKRLATPRVVVAATEAAGRRKQQPPTPSSSTLAEPLTARKSSDLKRIRNPELRALALVNSPMIDSRRQQQRRSTLSGRSPAPAPQQRQIESAAAAGADLAEVKAAIETGDECERVTRAYLMMLHQQWEYFRQLIGDWREVLSTEAASIPEAGQGSIRTAIGMAELLCKKKFPFFEGMLKKCVNAPPNDAENTEPDATLPILPGDVTGYWTLVEREIDNVKAEFASLEADRSAGWPAKAPVKPAPAKTAPRKQPRQPPRTKTAGAAKAKSRFAEFRKKHLLTMSTTGVGAISSPMVSFATTSRSGSVSARKSFAAKTPGTRTPSQRVSSARTPATKTLVQNFHGRCTPEIKNSERRTSRRVTAGAKTPGKESGGTKTPGKESGGAKTPGKESGGAKTPGKESGGAKTPGKESGGAKTPGKESGGAKTPGKESGGAKTPGKESGGAKTPGKESGGAKTPGKESGGAKTPGKESGGAKTPGKESGGAKTPGKESGGAKTPGKESGGAKTPGKESGGAKTPGKESAKTQARSQETPGAGKESPVEVSDSQSSVKARIETFEARISATKRATSSAKDAPEKSPATAAKRRRSTSKSVSFNAVCLQSADASLGDRVDRQLTPYPTRQSARRRQANLGSDQPLVATMEALEDD